MRWPVLILNLLVAVGFVYLGAFAVSAHRTHAFSTYRYFVINHAVVDNPSSSDGKPLDIERRMEQIAAGGAYYRVLAYCGAVACMLNGLVFFFSSPRRGTPSV
jgi:hypothetical protein